jgi:phosphoesterase RecJ-like protein
MLNWNSLNKIISKSENIILSTHVNPDADGIGSEIGMYYYLKTLGKECKIINISPTPIFLDFIDPDDIIETYDNKVHGIIFKNFDLAIAFDIGDYKRLYDISDNITKYHIYSVSIDHHPYSDTFFDLPLVDTSFAATGHMVWEFLRYNDFLDFSLIQSKALYAALITDTGSFRYNSTNKECHIMAAHLLENGVKPYDIYESIYERRSLEQVKLLASSINSLTFHYNGIICGCIITKKMQESIGANSSHIEGFTDFFRSINKVQIAYCIVEQEKNIRINFRSRGKYIINDIAKSFGGGGHKLAAGATVLGKTASTIETEILELFKRKI